MFHGTKVQLAVKADTLTGLCDPIAGPPSQRPPRPVNRRSFLLSQRSTEVDEYVEL
jgi:hypothetical protein